MTQFSSMEESDYWVEVMDKPTYIALYVAGTALLIWGLWMFKRIPLEQERGNIDTVELRVD